MDNWPTNLATFIETSMKEEGYLDLRCANCKWGAKVKR